MSWVDRELKRRAVSTTTGGRGGEVGAVEHVQGLWQKLEAANDALPEALRLPAETEGPMMSPPGGPVFTKWLRAPNGAGLGLTADAIRYTWPERNKGKKSHNFWIVYAPDKGLRVRRRVSSTSPLPVMVEAAFNENAVPRMLRSMVTNKRITVRAVRRKRLFFF